MGAHPFVEVFLEELKALDCPANREVVYHLEIDSTSTDLKHRLVAGSLAGTVVAAGCQRGGRGRNGRAWHSSPNGNLYMSLAVELGDFAPKTIPFTPLAAGVAAWDAISTAGSIKPQLKWPNDVLVDGRKLAGILCEVQSSLQITSAVVGLGVNIATREFPDELSETAVSLTQVIGKEIERPHILAALLAARWVAGLERLMHDVQAGLRSEIIEAWRERAERFGRRVRVDGIEGVTVDLKDDGRLLVMKDYGECVAVVGGVVESV
jgi:BirA family biotin operon repressor/biotin-[acetyl-CoA-carboxylase] ligase